MYQGVLISSLIHRISDLLGFILDRKETFETKTRMDVSYSTNKAIKDISWQRKKLRNLLFKKSCRITRIYLIARITQTYIIVKRMVSDKNYKSIWTNLSSWEYSATYHSNFQFIRIRISYHSHVTNVILMLLNFIQRIQIWLGMLHHDNV